MNPTESIIYITLSAHRLIRVFEQQVGKWQDGCSCFWVGGDHDEHVAREIHDALLPEKRNVFPGKKVRVHKDQLPLLEVPDVGYKGIRL